MQNWLISMSPWIGNRPRAFVILEEIEGFMPGFDAQGRIFYAGMRSKF